MILQVETEATNSEIEVRNSYSELTYYVIHLYSLKGKRRSTPIEQAGFYQVSEEQKRNIRPKVIFPLLCGTIR